VNPCGASVVCAGVLCFCDLISVESEDTFVMQNYRYKLKKDDITKCPR